MIKVKLQMFWSGSDGIKGLDLWNLEEKKCLVHPGYPDVSNS